LVLHAEPDALEVDVDDPRPVFFGAVGRYPDLTFGARVVESEVDAPESLHRPPHHLFHVGIFRYIATYEYRATPTLFDHSRGFRSPLLLVVHNDDVSAALSKGHCRSSANAGCGACDQCDRSIE
jgi:hypothetical protein